MRFKTVLTCLIFCILLLSLVACQSNDRAFEQAEENGCTCRVTYDLGSGTVNGNTTLLYCVQPDALLPQLGTAPGTTAPVLAGYRLTGFFVKDADGTEHEWNFASDRASEDMTLYAHWEKNFTVLVRYGDNNASSYSVDFTPEKPTLATFRQVAWTGHTFYGFYYDEEYTRPVSFPYTHALDSANATETVYAKYLDGTYTVIRTAADFKGTINAGTKYYLDADVDLTGVKMSVAETFSGAFIGNGHTVSGLSVTRNQDKKSEAYGLFNQIAAASVFKDVRFENVSVSVILGNEQNSMINHIGAFAGDIASGATLDTVSLSGSLAYNCKGRNLADKLIVGEAFGEDNGVNTDTFTADVTVTEVTD